MSTHFRVLEVWTKQAKVLTVSIHSLILSLNRAMISHVSLFSWATPIVVPIGTVAASTTLCFTLFILFLLSCFSLIVAAAAMKDVAAPSSTTCLAFSMPRNACDVFFVASLSSILFQIPVTLSGTKNLPGGDRFRTASSVRRVIPDVFPFFPVWLSRSQTWLLSWAAASKCCPATCWWDHHHPDEALPRFSPGDGDDQTRRMILQSVILIPTVV